MVPRYSRFEDDDCAQTADCFALKLSNAHKWYMNLIIALKKSSAVIIFIKALFVRLDSGQITQFVPLNVYDPDKRRIAELFPHSTSSIAGNASRYDNSDAIVLMLM